MKASLLVLCLALLAAPTAQASPIQKVIEMLSNLQAKLIKEGEESQKVYEEFSEFCEDRARELQWQIKGVQEEVDENKACMVAQAETCDSCQGKLEECSAELKKDEADLKAATEIRDKEAADFAEAEAELSKIVDILERAIAILEREMSKTYTMLQLKGAGSMADALKVIVGALGLNVADTNTLTAFVQSNSGATDSEAALGAPDPSAYKSHSGDIVATLQELLDKAKGELDQLRSKETADQMNYEMLEQALKGEITADEKCIDDSNKCLGDCKEAGAQCEADFNAASKDLALLEKELADLHKDCMEKAQDFEMEVKSRAEELKALAEAKKVIKESTGGEGGAEDLTYDLNQEGVSLLQTASGTGSASFEAVRFVRALAQKQRSPALAQLAVRMASLVQSGERSGDDQFAKVKELIKEMIERLLKEGEAEAKHKAFCDKEMAESKAKKEDKEDEIAKLTAAIDRMTARSAQLTDEVAKLQKELAELAAAQAEMDKLRAEEKAVFEANKPELEEGLEGIKLALKILREYYAKEDKAHTAGEGASTGIIGLLEVVESDISKELAEIISVEEAAAAKYEKETKENEILKVTMEQDVKYKTKEIKELEEALAEATTDRQGVQAELDAVLEYIEKLEDQCIAKPEPYEERVRRREAEIAGLKEALEILEGEAVLLQQASAKQLRGPRSH